MGPSALGEVEGPGPTSLRIVSGNKGIPCLRRLAVTPSRLLVLEPMAWRGLGRRSTWRPCAY